MAGGLLLGVAATGLIGSVGTRSQQAHPPSTSPSTEGTPQGAASPIPTTAPPQGSGAAPAGATGPPACLPGDLGVSVASDRTTYRPGDAVRMTSSVVDRSARACTVLARCAPPDVFATFRPSAGGHSIDFYESRQSRSCADSVAAHVLRPGQPVVQQDSTVAAMPRGGPGCGSAPVDLTAQVFLLGADQFVHAVQATGGFSVAGAACPQSTHRGPLG